MFIVVEGLDGSGKSTQAKILAEHLRSLGRTVLTPRDPGSTVLGDKLRSLLLEQVSVKIGARTEVLLFSASRAQLFDEIIIPALEAKHDVVLDRWAWSTFAYQVDDESIFPQDIEDATRIACRATWPELSFILDISIATMAERLDPKKADRFESRGKDFYRQVRVRYHWLVSNFGGIQLIDGERDKDVVATSIWHTVEQYL